MRNPALIPLSREHHYALVFCRTIRRGAERFAHEEAWLAQWCENARRFFQLDLQAHFEAEEAVLFPACRRHQLDAIVDELLAEHRLLEQAFAGVQAGTLRALADQLEAHIRKEERLLFPAVDEQLTAEETPGVQAEIERRIGLAEKPRHPELLQDPQLTPGICPPGRPQQRM